MGAILLLRLFLASSAAGLYKALLAFSRILSWKGQSAATVRIRRPDCKLPRHSGSRFGQIDPTIGGLKVRKRDTGQRDFMGSSDNPVGACLKPLVSNLVGPCFEANSAARRLTVGRSRSEVWDHFPTICPLIPDPQSNPQNARSYTTSVVLGVPHGLVSR